jgi:hypothetical protein
MSSACPYANQEFEQPNARHIVNPWAQATTTTPPLQKTRADLLRLAARGDAPPVRVQVKRACVEKEWRLP